MWDWLFGNSKEQNPANAAMPYLNQIGGYYNQAFNPYMQAGQGELPNLESQYGQLTGDPGAVMNRIGSGFKQSPGYQWQLNQGLQGADKAAAAGGYLGTNAHQQFADQTSQGIANQDYYNYLNHALGLYGQGLSGEQGLANM